MGTVSQKPHIPAPKPKKPWPSSASTLLGVISRHPPQAQPPFLEEEDQILQVGLAAKPQPSVAVRNFESPLPLFQLLVGDPKAALVGMTGSLSEVVDYQRALLHLPHTFSPPTSNISRSTVVSLVQL